MLDADLLEKVAAEPVWGGWGAPQYSNDDSSSQVLGNTGFQDGGSTRDDFGTNHPILTGAGTMLGASLALGGLKKGYEKVIAPHLPWAASPSVPPALPTPAAAAAAPAAESAMAGGVKPSLMTRAVSRLGRAVGWSGEHVKNLNPVRDITGPRNAWEWDMAKRTGQGLYRNVMTPLGHGIQSGARAVRQALPQTMAEVRQIPGNIDRSLNTMGRGVDRMGQRFMGGLRHLPGEQIEAGLSRKALLPGGASGMTGLGMLGGLTRGGLGLGAGLATDYALNKIEDRVMPSADTDSYWGQVVNNLRGVGNGMASGAVGGATAGGGAGALPGAVIGAALPTIGLVGRAGKGLFDLGKQRMWDGTGATGQANSSPDARAQQLAAAQARAAQQKAPAPAPAPTAPLITQAPAAQSVTSPKAPAPSPAQPPLPVQLPTAATSVTATTPPTTNVNPPASAAAAAPVPPTTNVNPPASAAPQPAAIPPQLPPMGQSGALSTAKLQTTPGMSQQPFPSGAATTTAPGQRMTVLKENSPQAKITPSQVLQNKMNTPVPMTIDPRTGSRAFTSQYGSGYATNEPSSTYTGPHVSDEHGAWASDGRGGVVPPAVPNQVTAQSPLPVPKDDQQARAQHMLSQKAVGSPSYHGPSVNPSLLAAAGGSSPSVPPQLPGHPGVKPQVPQTALAAR